MSSHASRHLAGGRRLAGLASGVLAALPALSVAAAAAPLPLPPSPYYRRDYPVIAPPRSYVAPRRSYAAPPQSYDDPSRSYAYADPADPAWVEAELARRCNIGRLVGGLVGGGVGYAASRQDGRAWAVPLGALLGTQMGCNVGSGRAPLPW